MVKNKIVDKLKEGVSVQEMEDFVRQYTTEVFTVLAIVIGAISSMYDFFTGPKLTILFLMIGILLGVFATVPVEKGLNQLYAFIYKQEKTAQIVMGAVQIIVALFIPFLLFGVVGLLGGTAYQYFNRHAQKVEQNEPRRSRDESSDDEHH